MIWFVSTRLLPKVIVLLHQFLQVPQLSFGLLLGGLFLVVVGAERVGLHGSLGALLFGAALSMLPYQVRRDIMPGMKGTAEGFFVPLFFASAGLHLSTEFLKLPPETILALVLVPLAGKFAAAFISAYITRLDAPFAIATGLMAKGVAEIALLLLLFQTGAIDKGVFSLLVLVMLGYILLTPMGITFAIRRLEHSDEVTPQGQAPPSLDRFALEGIRVRDVLDRSRSYPQQSLTVKAFAEHWLLPEQHDYVVVDQGKLAGIVSISMLRYLPRSEWERTPLSRVLRQNTPHAFSDEFVEDALQRMIGEFTNRSPSGRQGNEGADRLHFQPRSPGDGCANCPGARNLDQQPLQTSAIGLAALSVVTRSWWPTSCSVTEWQWPAPTSEAASQCLQSLTAVRSRRSSGGRSRSSP